MAEIPFYVFAGYMANGVGTRSVSNPPLLPGVPILTDWSATNFDPFYNYGERASGFGSGNPVYGLTTQPSVWNHDSFAGSRIPTSSIAAGGITTVTLSVPHTVQVGTQREVNIEGVTGADAARLNGRHFATFTSSTEFTIPVNSISLTFNATAALAGIAGWSQLIATVVQGVVNSDTDPSFGGANLPQSTTDPAVNGNTWGPIVTAAAPIHEKNGPEGLSSRFLQVGGPGPLLGRTPFRVTGVTRGLTTTLTLEASVGDMRMREDNARTQPVTLYGFTGSLAVLNGRQLAYNEGGRLSMDLKLDVDTSAADPYTSGAIAYTSQRWMEGLDGEMFDEFRDRVRECVNATAPDTLVPRGLSFGVAAADVVTRSNDNASQQGRFRGLAVADVSDTGFPVRVTLADPVALTQTAPGARYGLVGKLSGAGDDLAKLVDVQVISPTQIDLMTENAVVFESVGGISLDVGEPIRYFADEYARTVRRMQEILMEETGVTEYPPTALYNSFVTTEDRVAATAAAQPRGADPQIFGEAARGITFASSVTRKIGPCVVDPDEVGVQFNTNSSPTPNTNAALGTAIVRAWEELEAAEASTSTGALPVYVFLGDSTCEGTVNYAAVVGDGNGIYTALPTTVRQGEKIWNATTETVEDYLPTQIGLGILAEPGNGNTHPVMNLNGLSPASGRGVTVGPEAALFYEQKRKHPDSDVVFLKLGTAGSTVGPRTTTFPIDSVTISNNGNGDPRIATLTLSGVVLHRRADTDRPFQVTLPAVPGISQGLVAGSYQATGTGALTIEIETVEDISGTYAGGGTVDLPNYSWRRADDDAWFYLDREWRRLLEWSNREGKQLDVRGVFVMLGVNDAIGGNLTTFEADATQLVADLRELFTTRSSPTPPLPIVWTKPRSSVTYPFNQQNLASVQTSLQSIAAQDPNLALFDPDTADDADIEINRFPLTVDGIHYTWEGTVNVGKEQADSFDLIDNTGSATTSPEVSGAGGGGLVEFTG